MNATWITLAVLVVAGITKLLTYLLGKKRKLRILREKIKKKELEYAQALAKNDTVAISLLTIELHTLRADYRAYQ